MKGSESIRKEVEVEAGIEVKRKLNWNKYEGTPKAKVQQEKLESILL
jgi:hypothetical protein